jgi:hypothetical protein
MQITEPINRTLATLASLETRKSESVGLSRLRQEKASMPSDLRTDWQRRNLRLVVTHPKVQEAADACEKLAKKIVNKDALIPLLVLWGNNGCGKSHFGKRFSEWIRANSFAMYEQFGHDHPVASMSASWPEVADAFKEGEYGIVRDLCESDFVFIDDIGAEHDPSKNAADKLCQILSRRENKWSIVTTNIQPAEWEARWDARIADRLLRRSVVVDMSQVPSFSTL